MNRFLKIVSFAVVLFVLLPLLPLFLSFYHFESDLWLYFSSHMFLGILGRTLLLLLGVGVGTLFLGVSCAWICSTYDFPGRHWMSQCLILPLAIPGYIYSFVYIGMMDFSGPIQVFLREKWGWNIGDLFHFRSVWGLIFVMSLSLFPYVYLLAEEAFSTQSERLKEAALSLGLKSSSCFWSFHLPMAKPWIVSGLGLILMETLADFGSVAVFNYQTFTLGVYKMWYGFFSWPMAAQMSSLLIFFVFLFFFIRQRSQKQRHFYSKIYRERKALQPMRGKKAWMFTSWIALILFFSLGLPVIQLIHWGFQKTSFLDFRLYTYLLNSLSLGLLGSFLILFCSLAVVLARRQLSSFFSLFFYAFPA